MVRKYVGSILFLCLLIGITIYVLIENNDMRAVAAAMARAEHIWILAGILAALFFVAAEGSIICYLLRAIGRKMPLLKCISWSFIGFFFSGVLSANGNPAFSYSKAGQAVPLWQMA